MSVVVIGDANVDLEIRLPTGSQPTHANPDPEMKGGGSAANTAAALGRLGVPTRFIGAVGDDAAGRYAVDSLAGSSVDVTGVETVTAVPTVMVVVVVQPDGERLIYVWPPRGGAHAGLEPDIAVGSLDRAEWLHVSGICLRVSPAREAMLAAMDKARVQGIPVSLDLNLRLENWGWEDGFRDVVLAAVERSDLVLGAATDEVSALADCPDTVEAARRLAADDRVVVARLGQEGAVGVGFDEVSHVPGFDVPVVDTVGAGDAFDAGFIAARIEGRSTREALTWGNAVAGLTIGRRGARSTPTRTEMEEFLETRRSQ